MAPFASESTRSRFNGQLLSELLNQRGPLALDLCLRYATEIATALREMHQDGRCHGSVDPSHVIVRSSGAMLAPSERRGYPDPMADLTGFGAVLYAMLEGRTPDGDEFRLIPAKPAGLKGATGLRAAAIRLAERCLAAERDSAPDFQKIVTEVRLLNVIAKQHGIDHVVPVPAAFPQPQPLAVFAGKAAPVIHPPVASPPAAAALPDPEKQHPLPADPSTPGDDSPATRRALGSDLRPVLLDVACPKCNGFHVRLSRPRTAFERFLNILGIGIHRCHRCFYRYVPLLGRKMAGKAD